MRARTLALLAATLGVLALAPSPAPAKRPPRAFVGMWSNELNNYGCGVAGTTHWKRELGAMGKAGVGVLRRPVDVRCTFAATDELVLAAAKRRIRLMPVLLDLRNFSSFATHGAHPPPNFHRFAQRARRLAHRYGPHGTLWRHHRRLRRYAIRAWQVWNEPNLPVWWRPRPNPRGYVRLLRATSRAIHRAERHAVIISAGLPDSSQSVPYSYSSYLRRFLRAGGRRYAQAIGVQAYSPTVPGVLAVLRTYRGLLNHHRARRKPLWVTEFGWADRGPRNAFVVGARGQARRIKAAYRAMAHRRKRLRIKGIVYYQWIDTPVTGHDTWGLHTGLIRRSGKPKPALKAWKRAIRHL
jgi:hypothetical protein